jgi:hypothetical protein
VDAIIELAARVSLEHKHELWVYRPDTTIHYLCIYLDPPAWRRGSSVVSMGGCVRAPCLVLANTAAQHRIVGT